MSESASNASSSDMGSDMEMAKGTSDNHSGPVPTERIDAIFMHPQDEPNAVIIELGKECAHKVNRFRKVPLPFGLGFNETPVAPWGALWEEALRQLEGVRQPDYAAALREMVPASKIVDSNSLERNFVCLVDTKILRILQDTKAPESSRILAELVNPDLLAHIYRELKCICRFSIDIRLS
ncbi:hypothetical protein QFC19_004088 [Naganishia cerealis]|uniref:Uncharacterized protein n=1 Tax=Naganishia cerealis TaxID=610337 RepID=A0ACC2VYG5_9TREE|nr:hypothetical protein QFC19_004088 [Naganishia cerealis]